MIFSRVLPRQESREMGRKPDGLDESGVLGRGRISAVRHAMGT